MTDENYKRGQYKYLTRRYDGGLVIENTLCSCKKKVFFR